jgi:hypothetical protein
LKLGLDALVEVVATDAERLRREDAVAPIRLLR